MLRPIYFEIIVTMISIVGYCLLWEKLYFKMQNTIPIQKFEFKEAHRSGIATTNYYMGFSQRLRNKKLNQISKYFTKN